MNVLVTGGSRGIGGALVRACVARGDAVVWCARTVDAPIEGAFGIAVDVTSPADVVRLIETAIDRLGHVDVLVNNAALPGGDFEEVLKTNAYGPYLCATTLLARSKNQVRIVNVSSGVATTPRAGASAYIASKHALEGLTRALAVDHGDRAVVTAVQLGDPNIAPLLDAMTAPDVHGRIVRPWRNVRPLDLGGADRLRNPLGPSPKARAALEDWAKHDALERYPAAGPLAKILAATHGVPLDWIALGAGIGELLDRVLAMAVRAGETIVANAPNWPLFGHICRARDFVWRPVPYVLDGNRASHALDAVLDAIDPSVRAVYLVTPSNPMAIAIDTPDFERFIARVPPTVTVLVDEAYVDYATRANALNATRFVKHHERLVVFRTFSKMYGLAGLRIGYAVSPLGRAIAAKAPPFGIARGAEIAAAAALGDSEHVRRTLEWAASARAKIDALESDAPFVLARRPGDFFDGTFALVPLAEVSDG
jgi:histidinol-phosphate aminotransferase